MKKIARCLFIYGIFILLSVLLGNAEIKELSASAEMDIFDSQEIASFTIAITPQDWEKMQPKRPEGLRPGPPMPPPAGGFEWPPPPPPEADGVRRGGFPPPPREARPGGGPRFMIGIGESNFEYVKGTVKYKDERYDEVGIRFKGNSSFRSSGDTLKKPFKFDFDRFVKDQTFHGYNKLNFSNGFKDPSLMREKLAYDLFQKAKVPAPRAAYARLYLTVEGRYDQEYLGLYTMVEQVAPRFLKDRFGNGDGLLVKPDRVNDFEDFGEDWKRYAQHYELKSKEKTSDTARLIQFIKFLHNSDDAQFAQEIEQFLNVDSFLRFLAVNTLLVNLDSYLGTGHNYYLYHNTATGQYEMIPWDLNEAFGNFQMGNIQQMLSLDIDQPSAGKKLLIDRLLKIEKYKEQYHANLRELIETHFHPERMSVEIDRLYALIHDAVIAETHNLSPPKQFEKSLTENIVPERGPGMRRIFRRGEPAGQQEEAGNPPEPMPPPSPMRWQSLGLKPFVVSRVESVKAQLNGEQEGYIIEVPRPGFMMRRGFPGQPGFDQRRGED
ncbi:CotH kinase family protein [Candidatus Poribacteria bacterium]|nr:CotH kinase family protein [Candidatus Poribacteria bacterium]